MSSWDKPIKKMHPSHNMRVKTRLINQGAGLHGNDNML